MSRSDALSTISHLADTGARWGRDVRLPDVDLSDLSLPDVSDLRLPEVRLPDVHLPDVSAPDLGGVRDTVRRRPSWVVMGALTLVATIGIVVVVRRRRAAADSEESAGLASVA